MRASQHRPVAPRMPVLSSRQDRGGTALPRGYCQGLEHLRGPRTRGAMEQPDELLGKAPEALVHPFRLYFGAMNRRQILDLSGQGLAVLPFSMEQLRTWSGLDLDRNQLAALPEQIGALTQLKSLS